MQRQPSSRLDLRFWVLHLALPLILFVAAAAACEMSSIDISLADRFFDFGAGVWPARDSRWAEWLIHKRGRDLITVISVATGLVWLFSYRVDRLRSSRWLALYLLLAIGLGTGTVTIGKRLTGRHCPWDIDRYGGSVPHTRLFEPPPKACAPGHCFPAGHASGGFSLMALYFAFRDRRRGVALAGLGAGIVLGSIYGYGQMARGAHFFSHNVWTAAICWFVALGLYLPFRSRLSQKENGPPGAA